MSQDLSSRIFDIMQDLALIGISFPRKILTHGYVYTFTRTIDPAGVTMSSGQQPRVFLTGANASELAQAAVRIIRDRGINPRSEPIPLDEQTQAHWHRHIELDAIGQQRSVADTINLSIAISLRRIADIMEANR